MFVSPPPDITAVFVTLAGALLERNLSAPVILHADTTLGLVIMEDLGDDRVELSEALWNVVENALKYAPDSPVHLRATRTNGHATIVVRDEGPGMTESERLHAFERFYRGDQRGEITGSGLGLSIAKRAIERAGGSIDLASAPNRGTTVTITL